jgi:metal transporter CNNM
MLLIPRSPAPIAWPIAKLLDHVLGKSEVHTYKKAELRTFLQFHRTGQEPLRDEEISILNGVLDLNSKRVETIMTPMKVDLTSSHEMKRQLTGSLGVR